MTNTAQKEQPKRTLESLYEELSHAQEALAITQKTLDAVKIDIANMYSESITRLYKAKQEPFGTINLNEGDLTITFDTPKNVKWDQAGLKTLLDDGAPVDVEYSLSEKTFKEFDQAGKDAFMPFRTVKPGKMQIKIERKEIK